MPARPPAGIVGRHHKDRSWVRFYLPSAEAEAQQPFMPMLAVMSPITALAGVRVAGRASDPTPTGVWQRLPVDRRHEYAASNEGCVAKNKPPERVRRRRNARTHNGFRRTPVSSPNGLRNHSDRGDCRWQTPAGSQALRLSQRASGDTTEARKRPL